jgi:spermidine/putrescine transport system permease protein
MPGWAIRSSGDRVRSLTLAFVTTVICLIVSYPFAYYIATRGPARNVLLVLVMIPFWSNFLVRTYAWRVLLGFSGPISQISQFFGGEEIRILFTNTAVLIGLVYGYCRSWCLPLYASLERMDWNLVEAARDLYASRLDGVSPRHVATVDAREWWRVRSSCSSRRSGRT